MNQDYVKTILNKYGLKPNKTFGQNFLIDEILLQDIADSAEIAPSDAVLEIGPGVGNLTELLLQKAGFVLAVEKDEKFLPRLKAMAKSHSNFKFEINDILKFNFSKALENYPSYKVVANIPYYVTGKIVQTLLQAPKKPSEIVLLMQKEVAKNLTAAPGELSLLAISVQLWGYPTLLFNAPARSFYPPPKVDSSVVKITIPKTPPYKIKNQTKLFKLLRAAFSGKRKQLHNTLKNNLALSAEEVTAALEKSGLKGEVRPQHVAISEWLTLAKVLDSKL